MDLVNAHIAKTPDDLPLQDICIFDNRTDNSSVAVMVPANSVMPARAMREAEHLHLRETVSGVADNLRR